MPRPLKNSLASISAEEMNAMTDTMTDAKIAKHLGDCSKNNVGHRRRALGVKSFGEKNNLTVGVKGVSNPTNRKYFFDERFFANIDTEIKAYALGLFFTDGHVTKELHRAKLSLTESDAGVLHQIAEAAQLDANFHISKPREGNYQVHNMVNLDFNSVVLVKDLLNLGLSPSKDNNTALPDIPSELQCHMMRGIIDGDGHIGTLKMMVKNNFCSEISGRDSFLHSINKMLEQHGFEPQKIRPMRSIHRLLIHRAGLPILDWAYGCNPKIAVPRKLKRYLDIKGLEKAYPMI